MTKKLFCDLDGTLIDCKPRLYNLFQHLVPQSKFSFKEYCELKSQRINQKELLQKYFDYTDKMVEAFKQEWLEAIEDEKRLSEDKVIKGVDLQKLQNNYELYVVTNRQSKDKAIHQLEQLGLAQFFEKILVTEQKKTKVELILENVSNLSDQDIIIGDTGEDIQTGKALNIKTVAVESGVLSAHILKEYNPDLIIESIGKFDENRSL